MRVTLNVKDAAYLRENLYGRLMTLSDDRSVYERYRDSATSAESAALEQADIDRIDAEQRQIERLLAKLKG